MKTYKSRVSAGLVFFISIICIIVPLFAPRDDVWTMIISLGIFAFILLALYNIKYVIDGQTLKVYYFWGIHKDIDIMTIRKMEPSFCLISSPAASLNRLAIYYNKYDVIYISPRDQEDFIKDINEIINKES